ncbi:hypothetical protein, conserved in Apicomplexan species [Plasmodium knowlesi strain H]|uniref:CPW-WPC domain-containing protein n=3 Tax=Plasmodium knowlesi TaxID=5850 RepID=A0A5E7WZS7_PLAKH|nr:CPW-WPC family protein [Plasmodium knowlesi strain H]OTN66989.1 Uncharacterized protein PKNOH_S07439400 [Plasmodium knowlesi]CAA9988527.1 CPW-WPC family protein [Plasmodium knowlesi strain H]SBO21300.1 hypothetical protein, conserved in Apicomplexan species [Plasmodium knowlesi strain H]SBO21755.1 hypothetical protein, conserved in Apicomplexan species [Plasmodium knowlesi strain H]VVS78001.1 CPW-WPC family protein [Plasmodium knowlesi strain H]
MNNIFLFFLFLFFCFNIALCENEKKGELFSDTELENIGGSAGDIITSSSRSPTTINGRPSYTNLAGELLKELKTIPPPNVELNEVEFIDPDIICERDYNTPCPNDYNYIGSVHDIDEEICAPSSTYDGPCVGEPLNIKKMTEKAKETWSKKCETFWPCKKCVRNFTSYCPEKWEKVKGTLRSCRPSLLYHGPCNFQVNFSGHTIQMLEDWSLKCHAWWICDHVNVVDDCPDGDMPITTAATRWRLKKNYQ